MPKWVLRFPPLEPSRVPRVTFGPSRLPLSSLPQGTGRVLVAVSALVGHTKATAPFWDAVNAALDHPPAKVSALPPDPIPRPPVGWRQRTPPVRWCLWTTSAPTRWTPWGTASRRRPGGPGPRPPLPPMADRLPFTNAATVAPPRPRPVVNH